MKLPDTGYNAWVANGHCYFNFYEIAKVYGPFKIYVQEGGWIVPPDAIYQTWPQGGKYVQIQFPLALVGGLTYFHFKAVTLTTSEEKPLVEGVFPLPLEKGKG